MPTRYTQISIPSISEMVDEVQITRLKAEVSFWKEQAGLLLRTMKELIKAAEKDGYVELLDEATGKKISLYKPAQQDGE